MLLCKPVLLSVRNKTRRRSFTPNSRTILLLNHEDLKNVQVDSLSFFSCNKNLSNVVNGGGLLILLSTNSTVCLLGHLCDPDLIYIGLHINSVQFPVLLERSLFIPIHMTGTCF